MDCESLLQDIANKIAEVLAELKKINSVLGG
jgi:hypothetical protein